MIKATATLFACDQCGKEALVTRRHPDTLRWRNETPETWFEVGHKLIICPGCVAPKKTPDELLHLLWAGAEVTFCGPNADLMGITHLGVTTYHPDGAAIQAKEERLVKTENNHGHLALTDEGLARIGKPTAAEMRRVVNALGETVKVRRKRQKVKP